MEDFFADEELEDKEEPYDYGRYPGSMRWATDQVPLQIDMKEYTLNQRGSGEWFIRGSKYDGTNRVATLQMFARAEGEQLMRPIIIFEGTPNSKDPSFRSREGKKFKAERNEYDPDAITLIDGKAWASEPCIQKSMELWLDCLGDERPVWLQLDNYSVQSTPRFKRWGKANDVLLVYPPGGNTDVLAVIDGELGRWMKTRVAAEYNIYFESSRERTNAWTDGTIPARERRILLTKWVGIAWREWKAKPDLIMAFM